MNQNRLAAVREAQGLSQERVAALLKIDRPKLSNIESNQKVADPAIVDKLAQLYGVTTAHLLGLDENSSRPNQAPEFRFRGALDDDITEAEVSSFVIFTERFAKLAKELDYSAPQLDLPSHSFSTDVRTYAVEGDAMALRTAWGLGSSPIGNTIFSLLEDHGIGVYRHEIPESNLAGAYYGDDNIGHIIYINACHTPFRQVFTAAHELAHLIYRNKQYNGVGISQMDDVTVEEVLCNKFASEFLMPKDAILIHLSKRQDRSEALTVSDVIDLQRFFGVSYFAMLVRLKSLGILKRQYTEFKEQNPVRKAIELGYVVHDWEYGYAPENISTKVRAKWLPRAFIRLVRKAVKEGTLSDRRAADYLNLSYEEWRDISRPIRDNEERYGREAKHYEVAMTGKK